MAEPSLPIESSPNSAREREREAERLHRWQLRLLPFIVRLLLGVTFFFFAVSLVQLGYLHWRIERGTPIDITESIRSLESSPSDTPHDRRAAAALMINAVLEASTIERRYKQGRVLLMSRVWTSYLGFVTGMALAMVGAAFVLGRIQGVASTAKFDLPVAKAELATSAPGLMLAFLGVVLMIATILVRHEITVGDASVYVGEPRPRAPSSAQAQPGPQPELNIPPAYAKPPIAKE